MTTIERKDLVHAVLAARDSLDPELESELLEAIVDAEITAGGNHEAARHAIDAAVTAAIDRGIGALDQAEPQAGRAVDTAYSRDEEDAP